MLTDLGEIFGWLYLQTPFYGIPKNQEIIIENILITHNIELRDGMLVVYLKKDDNLSEAILRLSQAIIRVADTNSKLKSLLAVSNKEINSIKLESVIEYLSSNGWTEERKISEGIASIWVQTKNHRQFSLLLPLDIEVPDFFMRMKEVLETLAYFENRLAPEILKSFLSSNYLAQEKQREILSIKFKFIYERNKKEGSAKKTGMILTSLQDLFYAVGQSESGKMLKRGKIQKEIIDVTEFSIIETFQGSFGVKLGLPSINEQIDLYGNTFTQKVFIDILSLVNFSNEEDKQKLKEELVRLKKISASRYRKFLMYLVQYEANFYADWGSVNPAKGGQAVLSFENAISTIIFINKMEVEDPEEYVIHGELISATKHKNSLNSVEIEDLESKKKYAARLSINTAIELTIGRYYSAKIQEISSVNPATGEEKSDYTVIELSFFEKRKIAVSS
ncbi:DUF1828 domain-containing protein [Anabaena sp. WFMT]|uniref:DUF1828 domain-containing protein n=1 Tax=Anabaena sp. WFMT TaxID=3449730 RepID=UPI003F27C50B